MKNNNYRFFEKQIFFDKNRDHCHLSGKYSGRAHQKSNIKTTQKQINVFPLLLHNFSSYDCHQFFKS